MLAPQAASAPPRRETKRPGRGEAAERLESATTVIEQLPTDLDGRVPRSIAGSARCVAVLPKLVHAGVIVGMRGGRGVVSCRVDGGWSTPDFFRMSGATAGLMAGVQSADLVMLVMTKSGAEAILDGKLQIGADTSIVAGPVGRTAQASTEILLHASIVYYSRSRGLFVGVDLSGTSLERDEEASRSFYGDPRDFGMLLHGARPIPSEAGRFRVQVERTFDGTRPGD
jgi:lipid-binding SYLF domain-containing protein